MSSSPRTAFLALGAGLLMCTFIFGRSDVGLFQVSAPAWRSASLSPATPTLVRPEAIYGLEPSLLQSPVVVADVEDSRFGTDALVALTAAAVCISTARAAMTRRTRSTAEELWDGIVDHELRAEAGARNKLAMLAVGGQREPKKKEKQKAPKQKVKMPAAAAGTALEPEETFFEGAPSLTETLIPGLSIFTVVGIIPFSASIARQAWTRYKITNRRIEVASGFRGKDVVQVIYREIVDVRWLRRWGGSAGDIVLSLADGSKLEIRSVPDFDKNLAYIMSKLNTDVLSLCGYPDKSAREYMEANPGGTFPASEPVAEASA